MEHSILDIGYSGSLHMLFTLTSGTYHIRACVCKGGVVS